MKTIQLLLLTLLAVALPASADIEVRLAVKFIQHPNGAVPMFPFPGWGASNANITNYTGFEAEVQRGNGILAATGRGYRLRAVSYAYLQPPIPAGQPQDYWYNIDARANRATIESAALGDYLFNGPNRWDWDVTAINVFVNNSASGQCSFVGNGLSISLGGTVSPGTVLHEIGHFFNLSHTHGGDPTCNDAAGNPNPIGPPSDGDGLAETLPDNACYTTRDQLSMGNYGVNYAALNATQQAAVNDTWFNVMSYHAEDRLLDIQMDHWAWNANLDRHWFCDGYTVFVAPWGSDPFLQGPGNGLQANAPLATMGSALFGVSLRSPATTDVILFNGGTYTAPAGLITTACTLRATRGPVTLTR